MEDGRSKKERLTKLQNGLSLTPLHYPDTKSPNITNWKLDSFANFLGTFF